MARDHRSGGFNHPHWDHGPPVEPPPGAGRVAAHPREALHERHRGGPVALIVLSALYSVIVGLPLVRLIEDGAGNRPLMLAAAAFLLFLVLPALATLLTGVRDLFR